MISFYSLYTLSKLLMPKSVCTKVPILQVRKRDSERSRSHGRQWESQDMWDSRDCFVSTALHCPVAWGREDPRSCPSSIQGQQPGPAFSLRHHGAARSTVVLAPRSVSGLCCARITAREALFYWLHFQSTSVIQMLMWAVKINKICAKPSGKSPARCFERLAKHLPRYVCSLGPLTLPVQKEGSCFHRWWILYLYQL